MHSRILVHRSSKRKLKKGVGLYSLVFIASGAMISSGLFILPGLVFATAGPSVILAYLLAGISIVPAVLSQAELVSAMPKSGNIYYYLYRSMGPGVGTFGGFGDWFSLSLKTAFALLGIGIFVLLFNPGFTTMQEKLVAVGCCVFFTLINIRSVKLTAGVQTSMVIVLLLLLVVYAIWGSFSLQLDNYKPFMPMGTGSLLAASGMVYTSFIGLTKICAMAGEAKNPRRNIPLALIIALITMVALYVLVVFVTVGLVKPDELERTLIPISMGASTLAGRAGSLVMGFAALLAFITTANAGILTASRTPMAMSEDRLLPRVFKRISKRGTPRFSVLFTSAFLIISIILFDLENLVKTASTLTLVLFLLANIAVIVMRESKVENYNPLYRSPLYPWMQIAGVILSAILISRMGTIPLLSVGIFCIFSIGWYVFYMRGKKGRDYALKHLLKRIRKEEEISEILDDDEEPI